MLENPQKFKKFLLENTKKRASAQFSCFSRWVQLVPSLKVFECVSELCVFGSPLQILPLL